MKMDKKAQAGMEYLMTYGWAIVLVAAVIGTLVLIVGGPMAEPAFSSSDPTKLLLKGTAVENNITTIKLQNVTGGEIKVKEITSTGYYNCLASNTSDTVIAGGELEILCTVPADSVQGEIAIQYTDATGILQNTLISGGGTVPMAGPAPPTGEDTDYLCSDGFNNDSDIVGDCETLPCIDCEDPDCIGKTGTGQYPIQQEHYVNNRKQAAQMDLTMTEMTAKQEAALTAQTLIAHPAQCALQAPVIQAYNVIQTHGRNIQALPPKKKSQIITKTFTGLKY